MKRGQPLRMVAVVFAMLMAVAVSSCESFSSFCTDKLDCEDGNDNDIAACEAKYESNSEYASLYGCSEWFDLWFDCVEAESKCKSGDFYTAEDDCDEEAEDYSDCLND